MSKAETYASVWDAIADTPEEAANLRARAELMQKIAETPSHPVHRHTHTDFADSEFRRHSDVLPGTVIAGQILLQQDKNAGLPGGFELSFEARSRAFQECQSPFALIDFFGRS